MSNTEITLPPLYNVNSPPTQELIEQIRSSTVSEDLEFSNETIEQIAEKLNFYKNMRESAADWKKAQQTSSKELIAASGKALDAQQKGGHG